LRIFTGFLILMCSVVLWFLPVSESIYAWKTDPRTDTYSIVTSVGETSDNKVLLKSIYDEDTSTVILASSISEVPTFVSYNATTRLIAFNGLTDNETRDLDITYDVSAFDESPTLDTIGNVALWLTYVLYVIFPMAGLIYIFWEKWFGG